MCVNIARSPVKCIHTNLVVSYCFIPNAEVDGLEFIAVECNSAMQAIAADFNQLLTLFNSSKITQHLQQQQQQQKKNLIK